jgi:hypothetical protein
VAYSTHLPIRLTYQATATIAFRNASCFDAFMKAEVKFPMKTPQTFTGAPI